jgi:uncharacterized membrane protein YedE/YeeE
VDIELLLDEFSGGQIAFAIGLAIGLLYGVFAQQSQFCLRAACVEVWRGQVGVKTVTWLLAFGAAMLLAQSLIEAGMIDTARVRQLNNPGSISGAIVGGLIFGAGMILCRGCASRMLILSATGNVRALVAGLVVTIVAQASYRGGLSPLREHISSWWIVEAHQRGFSHLLPGYGGVMLGVAVLALALFLGRSLPLRRWHAIAGALAGVTIALAWLINSWHAANSFDIVPVQSVSFTGPSADTLMGLINQPSLPLTFDIGLVPGVFVGAMLAALLSGQFRWQRFTAESGTVRYLAGAALMGFGAMLAGGCGVGAGVSSTVMLVASAWVALLCMILGAGLTDRLLDRRSGAPHSPG